MEICKNITNWCFTVGAGSAGGIVATRLSEGHDKVLLLEAGGSDIENDLTKIPLLWNALSNSNLDSRAEACSLRT